MTDDVTSTDAAPALADTASADSAVATSTTVPATADTALAAATGSTTTDTRSSTGTTEAYSDPEEMLRAAVGPQTQAAGANPAAARNPANATATPGALAGIPPELQELVKRPEDVQRLLNLHQLYNRQANELGQARQQLKQWDGLDPRQARELAQRQQRQAEIANLPKWSAQHPEYARTSRQLERARGFTQAVQAMGDATPEQRANLARSMGVTRDDLVLLDQHREAADENQRRLVEDPRGYFVENALPIIREEIQQFVRFQESQQFANQTIAQHEALIKGHEQEVLQAMDAPRHQVAIENVALRQEVERLRAQLAVDTQAVETAKAQRELVKGRTAVRRDSNTRTTLDPVKEVLAKGPLDPAAQLKELRRLNGLD